MADSEFYEPNASIRLEHLPPTPAAGQRPGNAEPSDWAFLLQAFVIPGLVYPFWHLAAPRDTIDPLGIWLLIGSGFLAVPIVHLVRPIPRPAMRNAVSVLASVVTLHLFVLASLNQMAPFFAVGSSIAVFATVLFIRSIRVMIAYGVFVGLLGTTLFVLAPDGRKAAYWGGTVPVLLFAYSSLSGQLAQRRELQQQVHDRTLQLSSTNQRLRDEMEERTRLEDELRVTHKMEAVGRLAGGVAHDFNNLVTTIGVYAELVLAGLPPGSTLRKEVDQIQKATRQAAALTQQLLTLGRRSHVQIECLDLNVVIVDSETMLRHMMPSHIELVLQLAPEPQYISGNIDQLQQVLINLAINARDAMTEPGRLTIETARCPGWQLASCAVADGWSDFSEASSTAADGDSSRNGYVRLAFEDDGVGMSAEARERAFDPFFTTKEPGRGGGLGLSIVHGIVSQANGRVRVESELGRGTRFELYWPLAEGEAEVGSDPGWRRSYGSQEEILLVEDEQDLREALHRALRVAGYRVTETASGEDALAIAGRRQQAFDLLVADVVMPRMNGFELAERMSNEHPSTKVLLISGHLSDRLLADFSAGIPLLAKPFDAGALTGRIRELLDGA